MLSRKQLLLTSTILYLGLAMPAFAQNNDQMSDNMPDVSVEELHKDVKQGWDATKETASETADAAEDVVEGAMIEIREAFVDRESAITGVHTINYHPKHTANNVIGSPVYNSSGGTVGNVEDILVDETGRAMHFIVGDGTVLSFGDKKVAFEYERIADKSRFGAILAPISDELIDRREAYDPAKHKGFSVKKMMGGDVLAAGGKAMASIDDIVITNGYATHLIVGFNKTLGLGGRHAALAYGTGTIAIQADETDIVLDNTQSENFEAFQNAVNN